VPPRIQLIAVALSFSLFVYVFELVRRRRLDIEYSLGWLLASAVIFVLSISSSLLAWITSLVGATLFTSTLFFFGLMFLILICLHFSVRISALSNQVRRLSQELALQHERLEREKTAGSS
jgi:hypothetical protein